LAVNPNIVDESNLSESGLQTDVQSWGKIFWQRFKKNRLAIVGLIVIAILAVISVAAPWVAPYDRDKTDIYNRYAEPSQEHLLGTDDLGRDILSRLIWGGRVSLTVGLVAVSISITLGMLVGALSGFFGGIVDTLLMRFTDIVISFPYLVLMIVIASILKPSIYNTMIALGAVSWPGTARLVRGEILSLKQREFVEAAHSLGIKPGRLIVRHLLPNAFAPVVVAATLGVAGAILAEAGLSFLGLGVPQPIPSWGNMLNAAMRWKVMSKMLWMWIPPGIMVFLAVISINLVGDGLRDSLDPRLKQ